MAFIADGIALVSLVHPLEGVIFVIVIVQGLRRPKRSPHLDCSDHWLCDVYFTTGLWRSMDVSLQ